MKPILTIIACMLIGIATQAHEFDGIDLNGRVVDISKQLAHKGYIFDPETGCLS